MPLPLKFDKVPVGDPPELLTVMSLTSKLVDDSVSVNVSVAVVLTLSEVWLVVISISGRTVSTVKVLLLPSVLALPPASVNALLTTLTTAAAVLLASGVKVAV